MKLLFIGLLLGANLCHAQTSSKPTAPIPAVDQYIKPVNSLTLAAASALTSNAQEAAAVLKKNVSIAILDAAGNTILLVRGDGVGPHNTEAARRKAFTALSTKTPTLLLLQNAAANPATQNLNTLPELLLLSGGVSIWYKGEIVGSIGIAGAGSPENDDHIARSSAMPAIGITTVN